MKQLLTAIIICITPSVFAQPPGIDDSIMAIERKWVKHPAFIGAYDSALKPSQFPLIYKKTNVIAEMMMQTFPVVKGSDPSWYVSIFGQPYFKGGPSPYQYSSSFKWYYYNTNYKKLVPHGEPGTGATIYVNSFRFLIEETGLRAEINGRPKKIYELSNTEGEWKGYPVYRIYDGSYKNYRMILLTKNNQVPCKPVTELEYLQAYKKQRLEETKIATDNLDKSIAKTKADIQKMRSSSLYANETGTKMIAVGQKALDDQIAKRDANIKRITDLLEKDFKKVDDYINSAGKEKLAQQAIVNAYQSHKFWNGFVREESEKTHRLVYVDQDYFDKTLPAYEPQFITVAWYWMNATPSLYFRNEFEKKFPVEKLQAMIAGHNKLHPALSPKKQIESDINAMVQSLQGPNNASTWTAIKNRISDYLTIKWKEGKLAGTISTQAFYVKADQTTMTQNDINEGRLIIEIGFALNKPAEFEVIRITQQL